MRLVEFSNCGCRFMSKSYQEAHDKGTYMVSGDNKKNQLLLAKSMISQFKRVSHLEITEGEIREIASAGRFNGENVGMGVHLAVAYCYIWAFGQEGVNYCAWGTKNTIPGAS